MHVFNHILVDHAQNQLSQGPKLQGAHLLRNCPKMCSRVFADVRGHSRTFANSRTFADIRGRSRAFAGVHGAVFADVCGCSRVFAEFAHFVSYHLFALTPCLPVHCRHNNRCTMLTHSNHGQTNAVEHNIARTMPPLLHTYQSPDTTQPYALPARVHLPGRRQIWGLAQGFGLFHCARDREEMGCGLGSLQVLEYGCICM